MKHLIKYLLICVLAIAAGIGAGYFYQKLEANRVEEKFYWGQWDHAGALADAPFAFVKDSTIHDFGPVKSGGFYTHDFLIENQGTGELQIWMEQQPDGPFTVELNAEKQIVRPTNTFPVTVTLDPDEIDTEFEAKFLVKTNDQNEGRSEIELTIKAQPEN